MGYCNLRCVSCMPEDQAILPDPELRQDAAVLLLTTLLADPGFDMIRLTGGEPTVRARVVELVAWIAATPGIRPASMTTNGILLGRLARSRPQAFNGSVSPSTPSIPRSSGA